MLTVVSGLGVAEVLSVGLLACWPAGLRFGWPMTDGCLCFAAWAASVSIDEPDSVSVEPDSSVFNHVARFVPDFAAFNRCDA